jgi:hypothetical protein
MTSWGPTTLSRTVIHHGINLFRRFFSSFRITAFHINVCTDRSQVKFMAGSHGREKVTFFFQARCTTQVPYGAASFFFSYLAGTFSCHITTVTPLCAEHSAHSGTLNGGDNFRSASQLLYSPHRVTYTSECPYDLTNSTDQSHCWNSPRPSASQ